ncbi:hypothetical protein BDW74DRAFT_175590 [Aspergillus multicolor]|uniref:methyltransferase family protein n=1 Tax=Aspergillus multicolor TaxID=41759 RepID=UPI003CCD890E
MLQLLFSLGVIHGSYLLQLALQAPNSNPNPDKTVKADLLTNKMLCWWLGAHCRFIAFFGLCHGILPLLPKATQEGICPAGYNKDLFTFTPQATFFLTTLLGGGTVRVLAFRQLQKNFTFAIAKASTLIKTDLYRHIQHPSYTGGIAMVVGFAGLVFRDGGVLSCYATAEHPVLDPVGKILLYGNTIYFAQFISWIIPTRVLQEEELLRKSFGREWEVYHEETARFIPWVL